MLVNKNNLKIGFIGQGWIGKNYADNFEVRGFSVVRYGLEDIYSKNKYMIKDCDVVFIAVPTPTIRGIFDDSAVKDSLKLVGVGKIAVIKSTIIPGTTDKFQLENPQIFIMNSPEFLREATARYDVDNPSRNIIGIINHSNEMLEKAELVMSVLPNSTLTKIVKAKEAELIKYASNSFLASKVVFFNMIYDMTKALSIDYENVLDGITSDLRIGDSHTKIFRSSGHTPDKLGRGAGGHCFIKDFEEYIKMYKESTGDILGGNLLKSIREKNIDLLKSSGRDLDILNDIII